MKNWLFAGLVICFIGLMAFQEHQVQKKYRVEATVEFWNKTLNSLEVAKGQLKQSDLPSKNVTFISDSLLTPIEMEITAQVQAQLSAENKKDSTKPKK